MSNQSTINETQSYNNDRLKDLKAFDEAKTGVKGLVDAGTKVVPRIFIRSPEDRSKDLTTCNENISVPVIDFAHVFGESDDDQTSKIVKEMVSAVENWGFFQVVNHGIPFQVLNKMIEGGRMFHEQDVEIKKQYYSHDPQSNRVTYFSNHDLYESNAANWRDSLNITTMYTSGEVDPQELPPICKDVTLEYVKHMLQVGDCILKLLSIGLGLKPEYLRELESSKGWSLICHYYPPCPEPQLTLGTSQHADISFFTIVLQDQIGGLQVLYDNQWVNVEPITGALIVNIGNTLQMISNGKFKSAYHRVVSKGVGPRTSIAFFFMGHLLQRKIYGPIKELISEANPPLFKDFTLEDLLTYFYSKSLDQLAIDHFNLSCAKDGNYKN